MFPMSRLRSRCHGCPSAERASAGNADTAIAFHPSGAELAAGIGSLIFVGLNAWTALGTFALAIPGLPHVGARLSADQERP